MHQLIIIGNGFDLACGLKSRFSDFLACRYDDRGSFLSSYGIETAWDIILSSIDDTDPLWCDVEAIISSFIIGDKGDQPRICSIAADEPSSFDPNYRSQFLEVLRKKAKNLLFGGGTYTFLSSEQEERIYQFMSQELRLFEEAFASYLQDEVSRLGDYSILAANLLNSIVLRDMESGALKAQASVVYFNYTKVDRAIANVSLNVHGSLESHDIVIGVDGSGIKDDSPVLQFTKTYRLLALEPIEHGSLFHGMDSSNPTKIIKFYGHSLATADYSYFQAIFDALDLYSSDIILCFYYSGYKDSTGKYLADEELRRRQYKIVSHLLTSYGETFGNVAHGDNLMHKLLLEGRLFIRQL